MPMLAENYIPGVPTIPKKDIEQIKKGFDNYIFISKDGKHAKNYRCTACAKYGRLEFPCRTYSTEDIDLFYTKHNEEAVCPLCKKKVTVKNLGITKKIENLRQMRAIIFVIPKGQNDVYFRCEFVYKDFCGLEAKYWNESYEVYHFKKGEEGKYYRCKYWYGEFIRPKTVREPFGMSNMGCGWVEYDYHIHGLERLQKTWLKYSYFCDESFKTTLNKKFKYLFVYASNPKITELLLKFGYHELIEYKMKERSTRHICRWSAKHPKDFFKVDKNELEEWKKYNNSVDVMNLYAKHFRGRTDGFELADRFLHKIGSYNEWDASRYSKKLGIDFADLTKYLLKADGAFFYWKDYIDAAIDLKYDLTVHNVVFPKQLIKAHDDAIAARKIIEAKTQDERVKKRFNSLYEKYGLETNEFLIRPPADAQEIITEGNSLKHCVGGYVERHANGSTNILFMRLSSLPYIPLYTIEIRGKNLIQVHGFKNRTSPEETPEAKKFFDEWLDAVKKGTLNKLRKQKKTTVFVGIGA